MFIFVNKMRKHDNIYFFITLTKPVFGANLIVYSIWAYRVRYIVNSCHNGGFEWRYAESGKMSWIRNFDQRDL